MVASVAAGKQQGRGVNTVAEVIEIDDEEQPAGTPIDNSRHVFDLVTGTAFGLCICGSGGPAQSEFLTGPTRSICDHTGELAVGGRGCSTKFLT